MIEHSWHDPSSVSLLVVDDNPDNLFVIAQMIQEYLPSCAVITTTNPRQALEIAEEKEVDGVICDIQMPQMNGIDVCSKLKESSLSRDIPVLLMTSHKVDPGLRARGLSAGADDFISKPIDNIEFVARIKVMLRIKRTIDLLNEAKQDLEQKVEQRTVQLVEANNLLNIEKDKAQKYLNVAGVMIIVLNVSGQITKINWKGCEILEATEEEIVGKNWFTSYLPANKRQQYLARFEKMVKGVPHPVPVFQHSVITASGGERILSFHSNFLTDHNGRVEEIIFSGIDITAQLEFEEENRQLQIKLQHSQKMESIGTLAGGIAHDFNNILSSIIGYTELALEDIDQNSTASADLQEVCAAGLRAKDLVKQILAFARQSEEESISIQPVAIANEAIHLLRSSIPSTIAIEQNFISKSFIEGNPTQLYQIIMNLCTNAAHAMEEQGGTLSLTIEDIDGDEIPAESSSPLQNRKYVQLRVEDTGTGISEEILNTIFEPYFTTKSVGEGTGMGLAMVQGIVESYGGRIKVDSTPGKGSTFTVYLPTSDTDEVQSRDTNKTKVTGAERVLFVDDEASIARIGYQFLNRLGYQVTKTTSSMEALDLFRSKPNDFDVVVSDMTMPEMTGDMLVQEVKKIRSDIAVVLCTGYSKRLSQKAIQDLGIKGVVAKPYNKSDLGQAIRSALDSKS